MCFSDGARVCVCVFCMFVTCLFVPEEFGQLDFEGLQMLTNPDGHIIDASSEDYFRMESLGGP